MMPEVTKKIAFDLEKEIDLEKLTEFMAECKEKNGVDMVRKIGANKIELVCEYEVPEEIGVVELGGEAEYIIREFLFTGDPERDAVTLIRMIETYDEMKRKGLEPSIHKGGKADEHEVILNIIGIKSKE